MSYKIEYKLKNNTWLARQGKYPGFYATNPWKIFDKFNDEKKRDKEFDKVSQGQDSEFLFRKVEPEPEPVIEEDGDDEEEKQAGQDAIAPTNIVSG